MLGKKIRCPAYADVSPVYRTPHRRRVSLSPCCGTTEKGVNLSIARQINTSINCCRRLCTCKREREIFLGRGSVVGSSWRYTPHMPLFDWRPKNNVTFATTARTPYIRASAARHESPSMWFYFRCNRQSAYNSRILWCTQWNLRAFAFDDIRRNELNRDGKNWWRWTWEGDGCKRIEMHT